MAAASGKCEAHARNEVSKTCGAKRKKQYLPRKPTKKFKGKPVQELSTGMQGVLITTNDKEKWCVSEAYNLLNEYADQLYCVADTSSENEDIGEQLLHEMKTVDTHSRFQATFTGVKNVVFIQCCSEIDPCQLIHHILCDIRKNRISKTRFCLRMIPVKTVCYASLSEIKKCAAKVLHPYFHADPTSSIAFCVHYKSRINETLKRDTVIDLLASVVTDNGGYHHFVNLKDPKLVVVVEIIKNLCCLSVLENFFELKQYNIKSITDTFLKACTNETTNDVAKKNRKDEEDCSSSDRNIHTDQTDTLDGLTKIDDTSLAKKE